MIGVRESRHEKNLEGGKGDVASENRQIEKLSRGKEVVLVDNRTRVARPKKTNTSSLG